MNTTYTSKCISSNTSNKTLVMSVENLNVIDFVSIDKNENVVLTISDHLEWDINNEHLLILQNKINNYLASIENGSFYENYPKRKDRNIVISIAAKYSPN